MLVFFLTEGEGEAEDWGVERTHGLWCGVVSAASFVLEGVVQGVEMLFLMPTLFSLVVLTFFPLTGVLLGVSVAEFLFVEHSRFLDALSCSALLEVFVETLLSTFWPKPPMLLLRFCSFAGVVWAGSLFWSTAVTWLLFSVGSFLALFFSTGVGALQYIMSRNLLLLSWSFVLLSITETGVLLPKYRSCLL